MTLKMRFVHKGGKGSGNYGHSGRPGKIGGSGGGSGSGSGKGRSGGGSSPKIHTKASLEELGVSKITPDRFDARKAAKYGVGSQWRETLGKVGNYVDDYLPNGDKVEMRVVKIGDTHYTVSHNGRNYVKQYTLDPFPEYLRKPRRGLR